MAITPGRVESREMYQHLKAEDLIRNNIETERLEQITLNQVLTENALVDDAHAEELGQSILHESRGQISAIIVRARFDDHGRIVYDVIDGFHRTEGKKRMLASMDREKIRHGIDTHINAKVLYACDDEELYDQRILAAGSVSSIQFSRIAQWITDSWATTEWSKKGMTINNALNLAYSNSRSTTIGGITPIEVTELKQWLFDKCRKWNKPLGSVREEMRIVQNSDPELVKAVRPQQGRNQPEDTITQAKLGAVSRLFPGRENYHIQKAVLNYGIAHALDSRHIEAISSLLKSELPSKADEEQILNLIASIHNRVIENPELVRASRKKSPNPNTVRRSSKKQIKEPQPDDKLSKAADPDSEEPDIGEMQEIEKSLAQGELPYDPLLDSTTKVVTSRKALVFPEDTDELDILAVLVSEATSIKAARARVTILEDTLDELQNAQTLPPMVRWWDEFHYLTDAERVCMDRVHFKKEPIDVVAREEGLKVPQVLANIRAAYVKRDMVNSKNGNK